METKNRSTTINLIEKGNKSGLNEMYIQKLGDKIYLDENLVKLDIVNFKITHYLYTSRYTLKEEYKKYGFNVLDAEEVIYTDKLITNTKAKISFKQLFIEYSELKKEVPLFCIGNTGERIDLIETEKPLIKEAYDILGVERVKEMNYNISNIKNEIISNKVDISTDSKIVQCLQEAGVNVGTTKTAKEWKLLLQKIYQDLNIKESYNKIKTAKATDLRTWFEVRKITPKVKGKTTDCFTIIRSNLIYR